MSQPFLSRTVWPEPAAPFNLADAANAILIVEQLRAVATAKADADKADVLCQAVDYEHCWHELKSEVIELRRLLEAAGIDPDTLGSALQ